jgi:hypothetical protein
VVLQRHPLYARRHDYLRIHRIVLIMFARPSQAVLTHEAIMLDDR